MAHRMPDIVLDSRPTIAEMSAADVAGSVDRTAEQLVAAGVRPGETVGLRGDNRAGWLTALLALLRLDARPLLLPHDSPDVEVERLLVATPGRRCLVVPEGRELTWIGLAAEADPTVGGDSGDILLTSSGSTGAPKIVVRSARSLLDEGRRYVTAGLVDATDTVVMPLPMTHSYALGWVVGALLAGARVVPLPPQALGGVHNALADGATVLAVVPGLARLLLRRLAREDPPPRLRLVMAGAGYVDAALDARWAAEVGVGLARNYGSTETGAVLYGPAGLPSGYVGGAMPGVTVELRDDDPAVADVGEIVVTLEDGTVHAMGDLGRRDDRGGLQIIGRRSTNAVRRGARWVSTLEVRAVLANVYGVADVTVARGDGEGGDDDETLIAEYVPAGASVTPEDLATFARANLAPYKVPNAFRPRRHIDRNPVGKIPRPLCYRLTSTEVLADAVRAYRASEVVMALVELEALPALAAGVSAAELAAQLDLDSEAVAQLIAAAHVLGLVTTGEPGMPVDVTELTAAVEAEQEIRAVVDAAALAAAIRFDGAHVRRDRVTPEASRTAQVRQLAGVLPEETLGEIGSGQPRYAPPACHDQAYDVCFVVDAVHGPGCAADLVWLAHRIRPSGRVVIEDRFLDGPFPGDTTLSLAWLATGATAWWRLTDLQLGLESVGLRLDTATTVTSPDRVVVVARRGLAT